LAAALLKVLGCCGTAEGENPCKQGAAMKRSAAFARLRAAAMFLEARAKHGLSALGIKHSRGAQRRQGAGWLAHRKRSLKMGAGRKLHCAALTHLFRGVSCFQA
jgi:hypothetical protein